MTSLRNMAQYAKSIHGCRQELIAESGAFKKLPDQIIEAGRRRVFLISGQQTQKLGIYDRFVRKLRDNNVKCFVFCAENHLTDRQVVERAANECTTYNCDAIVAFGGGSIIDIAKLVAVWIKNPDRTLYQMQGIGQIQNPGLPLYAVSTTGSGAESSACSIIRNSRQIDVYYSKYLLPSTVILDPDMMLRLPMDSMAQSMIMALTHAVEVCVSPSGFEYQADRANALVAMPIFFTYLEQCYKHGANMAMCLQMMMAPYYVGVSTRRIGFGHAHSLSMYVSERFGISQGKAGAVILPAILEYEFEEVKESLAELARAVHLCSVHATVDEAGRAFISGFRSLCRRVGLADSLPQIRLEECEDIAEMALADALQWKHPKKMNEKTMVTILKKVRQTND